MAKCSNSVWLNDLIGFVVVHLPEDGWKVELHMTSEEASLSLYDPDGDHVEVCTDGMNTVEGVIEHLNHARRACGLAEVEFPGGDRRSASAATETPETTQGDPS